MSGPVLWLLVGLALAEVVVRRRSSGVILLGLQSLTLGFLALGDAHTTSGVLVAAAILLVRGIALPVLLGRVIRGTREPRRLTSERLVLARGVSAVLVVLVVVALVPTIGLFERGAWHAAIALVLLGILVATLRRPVVFQAIGFLVAENGVYLASLSVHGGLPAIIELGLLADLVLAIVVVAAFGDKIHGEFGTSDTSVLRSLRD